MTFFVRMKWLFFSLLIATGMAGCAGGGLAKPQAPNVSLGGMQIVSMDLTQQTIRLSLNLDNPNAFMLPLRGLGYDLKLNGKSFISGSSNDQVNIPANGTSTLNLDVSANLLSMFNDLKALNLLSGAPLDYELSGSVGVLSQGLKLPFNRSGQVSLTK